MSESAGAAALLGDPGAQQTTQATEPPGGGAASPQPSAGGGVSEPASPASISWTDGIADADLKGYVQNKGWQDPAEMALGYRNLEKLLGGEKLPMPKGADDAEGWNRVFDALGRPKSAEEYKLPVPEGDPGTFAKAAGEVFHKTGITQTQAATIAEWWNGQTAAAVEAQKAESAAKAQQDLTTLRTEWGGAYDENVEMGRRAAREFGMDHAKLATIENALGTGEMLKFMARVGRGLAEPSFATGNGGQTFGMTPQAAQSRINDLRNDPAWASKYLKGDADARAEMTRLQALANPDG